MKRFRLIRIIVGIFMLVIGLFVCNKNYFYVKENSDCPQPSSLHKNYFVTKNQTDVIHQTASSVLITQEKKEKIKNRPKITFLKEPQTAETACISSECVSSKEIRWKMFTFVKSSSQNRILRQTIRKTWGSINYIEGGVIFTVFIVGKGEEKHQELLSEEQRQHGDLLHIDIPDNYKNLVYKSLASMQWASENMPDENFYSIVDDDMFVHVAWVQEYISELRQVVFDKSWPSYPILCMYGMLDHSSPIREKGNKYFCSFEDYKWPYWPDFCLGGMYTTSVDVIRQLWVASRKEKMLHLEDVWITGILRLRIGMPKEFLIPIKPSVALHVTDSFHTKQSTKSAFMHAMWKRMKANVLTSKDTCSC